LGAWGGRATGEWLNDLIFSVSQEATDPALQEAIEREANRREYKNRCNEPPPPGLDPCELARWNLRKAQDCKDLRQANTERWWGGADAKHDPQLARDLDQAIRNASAAVANQCKCKR